MHADEREAFPKDFIEGHLGQDRAHSRIEYVGEYGPPSNVSRAAGPQWDIMFKAANETLSEQVGPCLHTPRRPVEVGTLPWGTTLYKYWILLEVRCISQGLTAMLQQAFMMALLAAAVAAATARVAERICLGCQK